MSLQGQIEETGLGPIIQTLSLNRYRGTLRIETEAGSRFFFISEGEIVLVRQVRQDPVRLGDLLIRAGHLTEDDLDTALAEQKRLENTLRLGETLARMELVTPEQIEEAVRSKFEEDFLDLFLLDDGRFEFIFGLTPEALFSPDERLERITLSTGSLMMEAMRRVDEWQEMIGSLGSFDTIYRNRTQSIGTPIENYEFEEISLPKQARIDLYQLLDGTRSLREVIGEALNKAIASRLETFQYLHALKQNELVKPLDFRTLLDDAKQALGEGNVPGAAKLIRAILTRKETLDLALVKRYLEFLRKQQRPRLAFEEARRFAAQALASNDSDSAISLYEDAIALYRTVEVIDRLFYALLRVNRRKRAIEVGLELRDFLQSESDLGVATRVAQNLQELDGNNPAVLEFWGLILMRRERHEEATASLERALSLAEHDHPRRRAIVTALLELHPERNELRDEQELLELQEARIQLRRERSRRWISIAATLLGVFLLWRGEAEFESRKRVASAESILAGEDLDLQALQAANESLAGVSAFTTVSARSAELKAKIEETWQARQQANQRSLDELVGRRKAEAQAAEERAAREKRREEASEALNLYRGLVGQKDYAGASAKALEIQTQFKSIDDPSLAEQVSKLRVFARLTSTPSGAAVLAAGRELGQTPLAVPLEIGAKLAVRVRLPGYQRVEVSLEGDAFHDTPISLEPGPTWQVELAEAPLAPVLAPGRVVLGTPDGSLRCYGLLDGEVRWSAELAGSGPVRGIVRVGGTVVAVRGEVVSGLLLASGREEWKQTLETDQPLVAPGAGSVLNQEVAIVAGGTQAFLIEGATGTRLLEVRGLPAEVAGRPSGGDGWGFLPLSDRVVGFGLAGGSKRKPSWKDLASKWEQPKVIASGALSYARTAEALIVPVEGSAELRLLGPRTGVVTPIRPAIGPLVGITPVKGTLFCLGSRGQLSSFRSDGLEILAGKPVTRVASGGPVVIEQDLVVVDGAGVLSRYSRAGVRRRSPAITLGGAVSQPLRAQGDAVLAIVGKRVYVVEPLPEKR